MTERRPAAYFALVFIFLAGISTVGLIADRSQSQLLLLSYAVSFFAYFWLCWFHADQKSLLFLAIGARLLLFFGLPTLSDDVYRFIWDGTLVLNGVDPYSVIPSDIATKGMPPDLFAKLNSPEYHSVYPPLNQLLFAVAVFLGGQSLLFSTNVIRVVLLLAEIGTYFLLQKMLAATNKKPGLAYLYFLNPLVILEIVGNCHFEGFVIFFIVLGVYLIQRGKPVASGISVGLAVAAKLLPMIFLPAFLFSNRWKNGLILCGIAFFSGMLPFLLFSSTSSIYGLVSSLGLYFQKFEFNASIYYLVRAYGYWEKGYNTIGTAGPRLSILSALLILILAAYGGFKGWRLPVVLLFTLVIYLAFATTVHPWYILPLIPLGLLCGFRFPIAWSGVIFLTYLGYRDPEYYLATGWIALEYLVVFCVMSYELYLHAKAT